MLSQNPGKVDSLGCCFLLCLIMLSMVRIFSLIFLILIKPVWSSEMSLGRTSLTRLAMAFDAILYSQLSSVIAWSPNLN